MAYRRILTVQDISCVGQCSLTVALPIISACGHETCVLPTALLSTHTGGFGTVFKRELTDEMPQICAHWLKNGISFDAVYSGYLGSTRQIRLVRGIFERLTSAESVRIVDPAMADHGRLYTGFEENFVAEMKQLCAEASVIIPNITEACLLTGTPYRERVDEAFVTELLEKLESLCPCVVLTGAAYEPGMTGVAVLRDGRIWHYAHKQVGQSYHGTGDIFASAFVGAWQQGKTVEEAVRIAAEFTLRSIEATQKAPAHGYGVKFETMLPELIRLINEK